MQTKTIDKLEDLKGYEWEYNKKYFKIAHLKLYVQPAQPEIHGLNLIQINALDFHGNSQDETIRRIGENNLTELEFYGLKVILNEKPKLTRKERVFLELLGDNYVYIARSQDSSLSLFNDEPRQATEDWYISIHECEDDDYGLLLLCQSFPFITWESGKAWSKAELLELEVTD